VKGSVTLDSDASIEISLPTGTVTTPNVNLLTVQGIRGAYPVTVRSLLQYYTSDDGGNVAFNTGTRSTGIGTTNTVVSIINNPVGSGIDIYIARIVLNASHLCIFERYRNGVLNTTATAEPVNNRADNKNVASKAKVYGMSNLTTLTTAGNFGKLSRVVANADNPDDPDGSLIIKPGGNIYWMCRTVNSTADCAVELVWWELPTKVQ
jgi:hypothetical protein